MAEQVIKWVDSSGKIHDTEALADAADHDNVVEEYLDEFIHVYGESSARFDVEKFKAAISTDELKLRFLLDWLRVFLPVNVDDDDIPF